MATLAVTIGVGEDHHRYATIAASLVRHYLKLETFIIDDSFMPMALDIPDFQKKVWSLKLSIFDIIPGCWDRVMYFDNDWRPVRKWDVDLLFPQRDTIYAVSDRNYRQQALEAQYGLEPGTYFNAGWMVVPRSAHRLYEEARERYFTLPELFGEQCVQNQILSGKVTLAPGAFNILYLEEWPDLANVMAVHSAGQSKWNFQVYDRQLPDLPWETVPYPDPNETILRNLHYFGDSTTGTDQLLKVYESARSYAGGSALDVRSLRGHSALALALAGLEVRSYDTNAKYARHREGLISRHNLNVDFRVGKFDREFDLPETYNVVLHDAEHGDRTRPELEKLWNRKVRPGGLLIVHDVNQLNLSALLDAIAPLDHFVSEDENGRKMGYFRKP